MLYLCHIILIYRKDKIKLEIKINDYIVQLAELTLIMYYVIYNNNT